MKSTVFCILFFFLPINCLFGQKDLLDKLKVLDKRIDWVVSVSHFYDSSCVATAHYAVPMTNGAYKCFYVAGDKIQELESGPTESYTNKDMYLKEGREVYRIRIEEKNKKFELFSDVLIGKTFKQGSSPFFVSDTYPGNEILYFQDIGNVIIKRGATPQERYRLPNIEVLYLDPSNFNNSQRVVNEMNSVDTEKVAYGEKFADGGTLKYINFIKYSEKKMDLVVRTLKDRRIEQSRYELHFDNGVATFMEAYFVAGDLFVVYMDITNTIQFLRFQIDENSCELKSQMELMIDEMAKEYKSAKIKDVSYHLAHANYKVKLYDDGSDSYHILEHSNYLGKSDLLILRVSDDAIVWATGVPRGNRRTDVYNAFDEIKGIDMSVSIDDLNGLLIIEDIDFGLNFSKEMEFSKKSLYWGVEKSVYKLQIIVDLETGQFERKNHERIK